MSLMSEDFCIRRARHRHDCYMLLFISSTDQVERLFIASMYLFLRECVCEEESQEGGGWFVIIVPDENHPS